MGSRFERYIGIRYDGTGSETGRSDSIAVRTATLDGDVERVVPPAGQWSRQALTAWLLDLADRGGPTTVVGIGHPFGYPEAFLDWRPPHKGAKEPWHDWRTCLRGVQAMAGKNAFRQIAKAFLQEQEKGPADGEERLADRFADQPSPLRFSRNGTAHAAFAGIRQLAILLHHPSIRVWPFDWWPDHTRVRGRMVVAETAPALLRRRVPDGDDHVDGDDRDARAVAQWLQDRDREGLLTHYFHPPLTPEETRRAAREGWILGAM